LVSEDNIHGDIPYEHTYEQGINQASCSFYKLQAVTFVVRFKTNLRCFMTFAVSLL